MAQMQLPATAPSILHVKSSMPRRTSVQLQTMSILEVVNCTGSMQPLHLTQQDIVIANPCVMRIPLLDNPLLAAMRMFQLTTFKNSSYVGLAYNGRMEIHTAMSNLGQMTGAISPNLRVLHMAQFAYFRLCRHLSHSAPRDA